MKKSKQYYLAQLAVLRYGSGIPDSEKLVILKTLMDNEEVAKYTESREEQEAQA